MSQLWQLIDSLLFETTKSIVLVLKCKYRWENVGKKFQMCYTHILYSSNQHKFSGIIDTFFPHWQENNGVDAYTFFFPVIKACN